MTNDNLKNNYAYEIRFVDNNVVQVFDLAAKRKQEAAVNNVLPLEFKEDDVLKGQLRYSKLVGSTPSTTSKDMFGYEDTNEPYEHRTTTKISKNRKSTQRNTMFMMGGGGGGGGGNERKRYDSGTDFSNVEEEEPVDEYYSEKNDDTLSIIQDNETDGNSQNDMVLPSSPIFGLGPASPDLTPAEQTVDSEPQLEIIPTTSTTANRNTVISIPQQAFIPSHYEASKHSQHFSIDNYDYSSEKYIQQPMETTTNSKKTRDCCCIIS